MTGQHNIHFSTIAIDVPNDNKNNDTFNINGYNNNLSNTHGHNGRTISPPRLKFNCKWQYKCNIT